MTARTDHILPSESQCPHCKAVGKFFIQVFGDQLHKCESCGLIYLWPQPDRTGMVQRHATEEYAAHPYFEAGEQASQKGGLDIHSLAMDRLLKTLDSGARVLDIGSGSGEFLALAEKHFQAQGVEPSPELAKKLVQNRSCPIFQGPFEEFESQQPFDAINLMDCLEHTAYPPDILKKCHQLLKPGGVIFICTVDSRCLLYRLAPLISKLSKRLRQLTYLNERIFCYQHNWYFNRRVLAEAVTAAGFEIAEQRGYEFPIARLKEKWLLKAGLRTLYLLNIFTKANTEQYVLAKKR